MEADTAVVSEECSVISCYGITHTIDAVKNLYEMLVRWFASCGCQPDKIGVTGPSHSRQLVSFTRGNATLQRNGFSNVQAFELISSAPHATTGSEFFLKAVYDGTDERCAYVAVRSSFATLSHQSLLPIAVQMLQVSRPEYGIGYRRDHSLGPGWYAVGINFAREFVVKTGEAYEAACIISRWGDLGMVEQVWRDGLLRDVYPWNFLSEPQLNRRIDGGSLKQWIEADAARGQLSDFGCGLSLWELDECQLVTVRPTLLEAGAIFDWRKYA